MIVVLLCTFALPVGAATPRAAQKAPIPVLAYYYIWYTLRSWNRAKTDLPLLGPYSSDDRAVMRQHIRWAKRAGISGFIVSWKATPVLNRRLERLIEVAEAEDFKLSIVYQGLDFERRPLPVEQVTADLDYFISHYASRRAFDMYDRPLVIWSGTWEFAPADVANVTGNRRAQLLILASERNPAGYQRVKHLVDGNAYYWSSVNPETFPEYETKLDEMGQAVHAENGLWIAPAAPGFDARLIGGTRVVERKDGETLRQQINAAIKSLPDAIGLISWNEFSENSHVEPSRGYGDRYLNILAETQHVTPLPAGDFDSSAAADTQVRPRNLLLLGALVLLLLLSLGVIAWRDMRKKGPKAPAAYGGPL